MSKFGKRGATILGITLVIFVVILFAYVLPIVTKVRTDLKAYETRIAHRDNYKLHTTPLSRDVVDDICSKLTIEETNENCRPGAVVYTPDLFDEIKAYFENLPDQDKTYDVVQDKLGAYLDYCGKPYPDGDYRCRYDLRGDHVYPIFFHFDKNGMYYRITANTGGS
jgi:hypothetical protein